jgi:periplasmic protein CpxP/Spy
MKRYLGMTLILAGALAYAQPPQDAPPPPPAGGPQAQAVPGPARRGLDVLPPPPEARRPPLERALHPGPRGRWWNNPEMAQKLGLTADQQKRMDDIFQQNRLKLIDLNAAVQKAEVTMEPLVSADQPDEARIEAQIDQVAQARAELEKANARFLLAIRRVLTPEQWKKLQAEEPRAAEMRPSPGPAPRPGR